MSDWTEGARRELLQCRVINVFPPALESLRVFWRAYGWWWWLRAPGCAPKGEAVGPFLTTAEAHSNATAHLTKSDFAR